jgi:hypothetical protein
VTPDVIHSRASGRPGSATPQLRPTRPARDVANRDGDGLLPPKPLAAADAGVEKVSLQYGVVLRYNRNHYRGLFRALAFVGAGGVCRY